MSAGDGQVQAFLLRGLAAQRAVDALGAGQPMTSEHAAATFAAVRNLLAVASELAAQCASAGPVDVRFEAGQLVACIAGADEVARDAQWLTEGQRHPGWPAGEEEDHGL